MTNLTANQESFLLKFHATCLPDTWRAERSKKQQEQSAVAFKPKGGSKYAGKISKRQKEE